MSRRGMPIAAVVVLQRASWVGMAGWGRASASWRRATSRKNSSSPTPLMTSVTRVMGTLPWRILFSRSLTGPARSGKWRTSIPPKVSRTMRTTSDAMVQASSCGQAQVRWPRCFPFGRNYHSCREGDCLCGLVQLSRERRNPNC